MSRKGEVKKEKGGARNGAGITSLYSVSGRGAIPG